VKREKRRRGEERRGPTHAAMKTRNLYTYLKSMYIDFLFHEGFLK
jgi:hypothetical protein